MAFSSSNRAVKILVLTATAIAVFVPKPALAERGVPIVLADFDAPELHAGWTIKNTGTLELPRLTLKSDSYPGSTVVGVKGNYFSTLSAKQVQSGKPVDFGYKGRIESPEFAVERDFLNFNIGGGDLPGKASLSLEIKQSDGTWMQAASSTGCGHTGLSTDFFPVKKYQGSVARLIIEDQSAEPMGYVAVDSIELSNAPRRLPQLNFKDVGLRPNYVNSAVCYTNETERTEGRWIDLGVSERQLNKITQIMDSPAMPFKLNESIADYGMRIRTQTDKAVLAVMPTPSSDLKDYAFFWGACCMVGAKIPYAHEYFKKTWEEISELQAATVVLRAGRSVCGGSVLLTRDSMNSVLASVYSKSQCYGVYCFDHYGADIDPNKPAHVIMCMELGDAHIPVYADPTRLQTDYKGFSKILPRAERNYAIDPSRTPLAMELYSASNYPFYDYAPKWRGDIQNRFPLISRTREAWIKDATPTYNVIMKALRSGK